MGELDKLCWEQKRLFSYWAHAASLVPTEQFPIHKVFMRRYDRRQTAWGKRHVAWAKENPKLSRHILSELRKRGPLRTKDFKDHAVQGYTSGGWNEGRNVDMMLDYLWTCGKVMIAGRDGINRIWDLAERWLPEWTPTETISAKEATRRSVLIALRSLGVATVKQIGITFTRWRYYEMPKAIAELEREGVIVPVRVMDRDAPLPGKWYGVTELLEAPRPRGRSRTTLLSPFDPLIADRQRLRLMFGFDYAIEIYVPKTKRKYGYYVMPILHDGELVGRVDPLMDRKSGTLTVNGAWAEARHDGPETSLAMAAAVRELAVFLGANEIAPARQVPSPLRKALAA